MRRRLVPMTQPMMTPAHWPFVSAEVVEELCDVGGTTTVEVAAVEVAKVVVVKTDVAWAEVAPGVVGAEVATAEVAKVEVAKREEEEERGLDVDGEEDEDEKVGDATGHAHAWIGLCVLVDVLTNTAGGGTRKDVNIDGQLVDPNPAYSADSVNSPT
jgi:hypothetical protein